MLDTKREQVFDDLVALAASIAGTSRASIALVDHDRLWIKASFGVDRNEFPRFPSFCSVAIEQPGSAPLIVPDAANDARFADVQCVAGPEQTRFYAGWPIRAASGAALGTLSVLDDRPRTLQPEQEVELARLARVVESALVTRLSISELRRARRVAEASEQRFRTLLDSTPEPILRTTPDGVILDLNRRALASLSAATFDEVIGVDIGDRLSGEFIVRLKGQLRAAAETRQPVEMLRQQVPRPDGSNNWYLVRIVPELEGDLPVQSLLVTATNVNALVESEQRLSELALVDTLTGAANRAALFDRLDHALERLGRHPERGGVAVAVIDLDHFKAINDTFGHAVGDAALRQAVHELTEVVREVDTVARLGGDELAVIMEEVDSDRHASDLADRLQASIGSKPLLDAEGSTVHRTASVGVAWTAKRVIAVDLVARADRAMYEAKLRGRARAWSAAEPAHLHPSVNSLLRDLRLALSRDQFELHYQPIIDRTSGRISACEALLRWRRRDELLGPGEFLEALLESGGIGEVGRWALRRAFEQTHQWRQAYVDDLAIHVNLSPGELTHPTLVSDLGKALDETGISAHAVSLEVTEKALAGTVVPETMLSELSDLGPRLVLDDFGTGVSSMAHLRTTGLAGIKIDRSFVDGVIADETDRKIVKGTLALAGIMELEVVAEGVETEEQAAWLMRHGCARHQGWLYHQAISAEDFGNLLRDQVAGDPVKSVSSR